jgi:HlyD family secretion protein
MQRENLRQKLVTPALVAAIYAALTVLLATTDGTVTEIFPKEGELVGTGAPIMNIAKDNDIRFIFMVREDYLPGMTLDTEVNCYVPALDRDLKVRITSMNVMGSYATWKATKALDQYDLKTFEVTGRAVNDADLKGILAGMTVVIK